MTVDLQAQKLTAAC